MLTKVMQFFMSAVAYSANNTILRWVLLDYCWTQGDFCRCCCVHTTDSLYLLAQVVEHHDVGVHVEQVVGVGWVIICGPLLRFGAFVREHVVAVFGFVIHTVKSCHLQNNKEQLSRFAKQILLYTCRVISATRCLIFTLLFICSFCLC